MVKNCFDSIDYGIKTLGSWIGKIYYYPLVLVVQSLIAFLVMIWCAVMMNLKNSPINIWLLVYVAGHICGFALSIYLELYIGIRRRLRVWVVRFKGINILIKSAGFVGVLKGFVSLSSQVEEAKNISLYTVGLMICFYVCLASLVKLFGAEDVFGVCDGIMALIILTWAIMPHTAFQCLGKKKNDKGSPFQCFHPKKMQKGFFHCLGENTGGEDWASMVFYFVVFLMSVFKSSEIDIKGFKKDDKASNLTLSGHIMSDIHMKGDV